MSVQFKWSMVVILVVFPLIFYLVEFNSHHLTKADAETATRQAVQYAMKKNVVKGSLRDTDIYNTQHTVALNGADIEEGLHQSMTRTSHGGTINLAKFNELGLGDGDDAYVGFSSNPPMLAVRSNVVKASVYRIIMNRMFPDIQPQYVIQNQKIAILEVCYEDLSSCNGDED